MKRHFLLPVLLALLAAAEANQIVQYEPNYDSEFGFVRIYVEITNNDDGAIYNSYDLYLFRSLGVRLWELPHNQAAYTNAEALMADWILSIEPSPVGEVNNKWFVNALDYNPALIFHSGMGYEQWLATQQNPNQDMMALTLSIPTSQLDGTTTNLLELLGGEP